jgi:prepilin-type N-terminal cleavage/methylation domain-containing protein
MRRGFTLIELLVVVSIISMLSSVVLSSLSDARAKARDTAKIREVRELINAIELFRADFGYFPKSSGTPSSNNLINLKSALIPKYIPSISDNIYYLARYTYSTTTVNSRACLSDEYCNYYHVAINLERHNQVLDSDSDLSTRSASPAIWGASQNCISSSFGTERCYDKVNI